MSASVHPIMETFGQGLSDDEFILAFLRFIGPLKDIPELPVSTLADELFAFGPDAFAVLVQALEDGEDNDAIQLIKMLVDADINLHTTDFFPCGKLPAAMCPLVQDSVAMALLGIASGGPGVGFSITL
jgi:hypothetical protein